MNTATVIVLAVVLVAIIGAVWYIERRRSQRLQGQFGPEYIRAINEFGNRRTAESELERRQKRVHFYPIRELSAEERDWFAESWRAGQSRFVDEPAEAVREAHVLVNQVMKARGYPVSAEFERNAEDLSVEYPSLVEHYRVACDVAERQQQGRVDTEDLRKAMVHYRTLFEELLGIRLVLAEEVRR